MIVSENNNKSKRRSRAESSFKLVIKVSIQLSKNVFMWFYFSNLVLDLITKSTLFASCQTRSLIDYFRDVCVCVHCCIGVGLYRKDRRLPLELAKLYCYSRELVIFLLRFENVIAPYMWLTDSRVSVFLFCRYS